MMFIDSGTSVNTVDVKTHKTLCEHSKEFCELSKSDTKLFPYASTKALDLKGTFSATITSPKTGVKFDDEFYVVSDAKSCLLSYDTAKRLKLISIINAIEDSRSNVTNKIVHDFDSIFHGLGKLKDFQLQLNIDDTVEPVHQKHRRVPFSTRPQVEAAIKQLYEDDICEDPQNTPTPWVSPIVVVPKPRDPDNIRLCVDMRAANQAIGRVKHPMPTVHELIHDLNGCCVFTKLDLNQGYHQVELHPDSRYITTFSSHLGLHRYKRLNFGVNAASEII
jgi:hypothetical protein